MQNYSGAAKGKCSSTERSRLTVLSTFSFTSMHSVLARFTGNIEYLITNHHSYQLFFQSLKISNINKFHWFPHMFFVVFACAVLASAMIEEI